MTAPLDYDVAVLGAGVAGITAATTLAVSGYRILLLGAHHQHPREFRAEKFGEHETGLFERLGLWQAARPATTTFDEVWVGNWGKLLGRTALREYATRYPDLVDALRAGLPASVEAIVGRVDGLTTSPNDQHIQLADGRSYRARLLVVATGLGDGIRRKLDIRKVVISPLHSLIFGYTLADPPSAFPFQSLTWRGERFGDGVSYLTLFPLDGTMRANLFTHWVPTSEVAKSLVREPAETIARLMPGLTRLCGTFAVMGGVEQRPVDLVATENVHQDGVVLIGDAFCTSCPSTGTGIRKVLTDVDRLAARVPAWLASGKMDRATIADFYADPIKAACDEDSVSISIRGRRMLMERGIGWQARRLRSFVYRRGRHELGRLGATSGSVMARLLAGP